MSTTTLSTAVCGLTRIEHREELEADQRPLELGLIVRLLRYTGPHARTRNRLLLLVAMRSFQLPALTWAIAAIIKGPITAGDGAGTMLGVAGFVALAISTQLVMHFRQRYALELGESVVFDLRNDIFAHLQRMPLSFFQRTRLGRIISRMTSDVEDVRVGVQEVLFVCMVQFGHMAVAAAFMLWYDRTLFLMVLLLAPVLWLVNHVFHRQLSVALRQMRESFSRVTATLAESVNGIRATQAFVRQDTNARMFHDLLVDHARHNYRFSRTQGLFLPLLDLNSQVFVAALFGDWRVSRAGAKRRDDRGRSGRVLFHGQHVFQSDHRPRESIQPARLPRWPAPSGSSICSIHRRNGSMPRVPSSCHRWPDTSVSAT